MPVISPPSWLLKLIYLPITPSFHLSAREELRVSFAGIMAQIHAGVSVLYSLSSENSKAQGPGHIVYMPGFLITASGILPAVSLVAPSLVLAGLVVELADRTALQNGSVRVAKFRNVPLPGENFSPRCLNLTHSIFCIFSLPIRPWYFRHQRRLFTVFQSKGGRCYVYK